MIVFVNGRYSAEHSQIIDSNLAVQRAIATTPGADLDPFDLLNQAFSEGAVEIVVADHQQVKHPVAIVYFFTDPSFVFANPRWSLKIGAGSTCTVIEYTVAQEGSAYFNNKHSRIEVKENARLDYVIIQQGAREEVSVNNTAVWLSSAAQAFCYTCTLDGKLVRNNLTLVLDGEGIDAHLHGLYLASGQSLVDNHTVVDHRKANSFSNELYKGVMDDNGKAVFNGKIFVRPDAQKTNAFQSNRNILLSETSNIHTKPQLEIWADDVKCSHGCTTGQLDEEALFYLRSRGIPKDAARGLLLTAFAGETLEGIHDETLRGFVEGLILKKLHTTHS
jgi:Fe-S cluster assembly protein SufD